MTEGLDGLRERLVEYHGLGARFAKWRATYDPTGGKPTYNCINANAHALARYAALCQENDIVPIVEPEVLMDGDNDIDTCAAVTEWVLKETFQQLYYANVWLEGIVLKPNMVISGKKCAKQAGVDEVAARTVEVLKRCVPGAVPGIAFLSGGQSDEEATAHLNAMNAANPDLPWALTFSYGRALQAAPQKAWSGKGRKRRRRAGRLPPPRQDERARRHRPMEARSGKEGGVSAAARCRLLSHHDRRAASNRDAFADTLKSARWTAGDVATQSAIAAEGLRDDDIRAPPKS